MRTSPSYNVGLQLGAWTTLIILVLISLFVLGKSVPFIWYEGLDRIWNDSGWFPSNASYNLMPMLAASIVIALGTVVLAAPLGVMLAVFIRFFATESVAAALRTVIELLSGIPSVVFGFWGLVVLVPLINAWVPPGASILAAILVLTLMVLPLIVLMVDHAISLLPANWQRASQALALQPWSFVWRVVLPNIKSSIFSGTLLQVGRALGETMAVLMVCGNIVQFPGGLFDPARTLTANIALEMGYATGRHTDALFVSALLLLISTVLIVAFSVYFQRGRNELR